MKKIYILISAALFSTVNIAEAQKKDTLPVPSPVPLKVREFQIVKQQWNITENSAGMGINKVSTGSLTTMGISRQVGDLHRAQEGNALNGLEFKTDRFDRFNDKLFLKGTFSFNLDKEYNRAWSDVFHTYNSSPYIFGSSVKGTYETQTFRLTLMLFTARTGKFNYGVGLDYKVADMSRQRDPRSRSYLLDYKLVPSITYNIDKKNIIGLNLSYSMEKEKMPNLTTVQTDPNLKYYDFRGLNYADGKIGGYKGFQRQFVSDFFGLAGQYNYIGASSKFLLSVGMDYQKQEVLGNKKQSPGSYNSFNYSAVADYVLDRGLYVHNINAKGSYLDGGADEFRQELQSYKDPVTGETTETWVTNYKYTNRYMVKVTDLNISYKLMNLRADKKAVKWSVQPYASYNQFVNTYYLPKSEFKVSKFFAGANAFASLYSKKENDLDLTIRVAGGVPVKTDLSLATVTELSAAVYDVDLAFHKKKTIETFGEIRYTFPLKFGKTKMFGYTRLYAGNIFASGSSSWFSTGFSIGLLTL